jgi:hypothetical protein
MAPNRSEINLGRLTRPQSTTLFTAAFATLGKGLVAV